jgi:hypothetical protein
MVDTQDTEAGCAGLPLGPKKVTGIEEKAIALVVAERLRLRCWFPNVSSRQNCDNLTAIALAQTKEDTATLPRVMLLCMALQIFKVGRRKGKEHDHAEGLS